MRYDYIIIGAGSAGAVLAARLSQQPACQVLLLEAGPDYRAASAPAAMASANPSTIITAPEYARFRYDDLQARRTSAQQQQLYWRGKGLGGSSAINGQIAIRATTWDLDRWAELGCSGWDYDSVLPWFCRLETDQRFGAAPYHGDQGPIPIYRAPLNRWGPVDQAMAQTALDAGFSWAADHNAPHALGVSPYAINSIEGRRVSTNDGYLEPARGRNNLSISGDTTVDQILFDDTRAVGVRVHHNGNQEDIHAGQILLCAGAVHSPAILQRSGVGPADWLRDAGITPRHELPVGRHLQDHPLVSLVLDLQPEAVPAPGFRHTNCCVRYNSEHPQGHCGDMMLVAMNRLGDSLGRPDLAHNPSGIGMLGVWLNQCHATGELRVQSDDPRQQPQIELNMLDHPIDLCRMRDGVRQLTALAEHDAVSAISSRIFLSAGGWNGANQGQLSLDELQRLSDGDVEQLCLAAAGDAQHTTSTCRMGAADDANAVVDPQCRVRGLQHLRVIDASVMPTVPCANTHLTTVMIAERTADMLINGYAETHAPDG